MIEKRKENTVKSTTTVEYSVAKNCKQGHIFDKEVCSKCGKCGKEFNEFKIMTKDVV